jgi:hypothetical protein
MQCVFIILNTLIEKPRKAIVGIISYIVYCISNKKISKKIYKN